MRTFIAIEVPEAIKTELARLQTELRKTGAEVVWAKPDNIHLTLRFLGEVEERRLAELKQLCVETAAEFQPFTLRLKDIGYFPNFRQPRVVWVGLAGEMEVARQLQKRLDAELIARGFNQDDKPFKPHLSIGRMKSGKNIKPLVAKANLYALPELAFEVGEIVLFQSELHPAGSRYTALAKSEFREN